MTTAYLEYEFQNGFIHNWLVAGPQCIPLQSPQNISPQAFRAAAAQKLFQPDSGVQQSPVEPGPLAEGIFRLGDYETTWVYAACDEDHLIQRSTHCPGWNYLRAWSYTQLSSKEPQDVRLTLIAYGPVDLWLDGKHVFHSELLAGQVPQPQQINVHLASGKNDLIARFANVAESHCPLALAVQVEQTSAPLTVRIPASSEPSSRDEIDDMAAQSAANALYSTAPDTSLEQRWARLMQYAMHFENNLYAEIARIAVADWENVNLQVILDSLQSVQEGKEGSVLFLATLLNTVAYYTEEKQLPDAIREPLEPALEEAALGYAYTQAADTRMDFASESRQILFHACEAIAGQYYPDKVFADGRTGQEHRMAGEAAAIEWMRARGWAGFATWESPVVYAETLVGLALLNNAAESEPVYDLASVLIDKVLFSLAVNTFQGTFASAHRRASSTAQRSGMMEETAGVSYLLWGTGIYNTHLAAPINLALLKNYELVPIFGQIAESKISMLARERQVGPDGDANLMTYRTGNYMLSSVQGYRKGQVGDQEQVWRATLGPNAVVYTNHPGANRDGLSEGDGPQPGFWAGNRSLPSVAQWKDVLIAIYNLPVEPPPTGGLGFTHAYFPTGEFDEYTIQGNWAFARKGDGYLALTASRPLALTTTGQHAYRELRAEGGETVWICEMGSEIEDGSYALFQEGILATTINFSSLAVSFKNRRGEELSFAWDGPFMLAGAPVKIDGFPQFESHYCLAKQPSNVYKIRSEDYYLEISFEE